jgi:hypothetical protein
MLDGLRHEFEAIFLERRLQQLQPEDLAAPAGFRLVAHRVDVHVTALVLRHVTGGVRGVQQVVE